MTLRAVGISLILIPLQAFWIIHMELVRGGIWPTVLSLLFTVVFILFVLALLNLPLRRWWPRVALRDGELLTIYILLAVGAALSGCDVGQTLVHILGAPFHFATPENGWAAHFHRDLPRWLLVSDQQALRGFYNGASTLYRWDNFRPWLKPVAGWMVFIFLLLLTMHSVNALVRRQWVEAERLTFPIVQLPLAMTDSATFWRQPGLWLGFGLAAVLNLLNGFHFLFPVVPHLNCKIFFNLGRVLISHPWDGIRWWPVTAYPFAIGLGFLMPLDLSFSCWFGLLLWKAQKVVGKALGYPQQWCAAMYSQPQVSGVWIAVLLFALWMGRRHWQGLWRLAWKGGDKTSPPGRRPETVEPFAPRTTLLLTAFGLLGMMAFGHLAGMTVGFAAAYMAVYLAFSLALTRMRAEFGPPCHDLYGAGPDQIFTTWFGVETFERRNLTSTAVFYWLSRESPRSHPMPHQLEGLRLGSGGRLPLPRLWGAMLFAGCFGGLATLWAVLHNCYIFGSEAKVNGPATWFATEGFRRLNSWIVNPPEPSVGGRNAMLIAFFVSWGILWLRTRVLWFPFHPAGYAISSWWAINLLWFPLLLAWTVKKLVLRYGGLRAYRRVQPFFFGLILGEFVVGSLWQIAGLLGGFTAYAFWI
ncbi:MAG TPA: hypothetical protein EYP85_00850 [Armatimonadetes bacterium]|nr:hypothetical protein [Armatimonadota bacterium]